MTKRINILLDDNILRSNECQWLLSDDDQMLEHGILPIERLPRAPQTRLILGVGLVSWLTTQIPKSSKKDEAKLLNFALEVQLIDDAQANFIFPFQRQPADKGIRLDALVINKTRWQAIDQLLRRHAIIASEIHAEVHHASGASNTALYVRRNFSILRAPNETPIVFDSDNQQLPEYIKLLKSPESIDLFCDPILRDDIINTVSPQLAIAYRGDYLWWQNARPAFPLPLTNQEKQISRFTGVNWRGPVSLLAATVAVWLLFIFGQIIYAKIQLQDINERQQRIFNVALPGTPYYDPPRQITQAVNQLLGQHGKMRSDDFISLLNAYRVARGVEAEQSIKAAAYKNGSLELKISSESSAELEILRNRLENIGVNLLSSTPGAITLTAGAN